MGTRAPTITEASTIEDICMWASLPVAAGGVGLDEDDVAILRREKIKGTSLFRLTDAKLKSDGMSRGAREDLLAAVSLLREPNGVQIATATVR